MDISLYSSNTVWIHRVITVHPDKLCFDQLCISDFLCNKTVLPTHSLQRYQRLEESHSCTLCYTSTLRLSFLTVTPTLIAASCRRRFLKALVVRTFPFLRHLLLPIRVMDLSTAESISADNARHLQPAGYKTHTTVWGRREEKCE